MTPDSLVGGGPLQVESLDVVLKCVTYEGGYWWSEARTNRFIRNLRRRNIQYRMETRSAERPFYWNMKITVGAKDLYITVGE